MLIKQLFLYNTTVCWKQTFLKTVFWSRAEQLLCLKPSISPNLSWGLLALQVQETGDNRYTYWWSKRLNEGIYSNSVYLTLTLHISKEGVERRKKPQNLKKHHCELVLFLFLHISCIYVQLEPMLLLISTRSCVFCSPKPISISPVKGLNYREKRLRRVSI